MQQQSPAITAEPVRNPGSDWDDNLPLDQTPPPDHEDFEALSAAGLRAMKERRRRRREMPGPGGDPLG